MFFRKWLRQEPSSFVDAATVYEKAEEGLEAPDTRIMIQPVIPDNPEENTCPRRGKHMSSKLRSFWCNSWSCKGTD